MQLTTSVVLEDKIEIGIGASWDVCSVCQPHRQMVVDTTILTSVCLTLRREPHHPLSQLAVFIKSHRDRSTSGQTS